MVTRGGRESIALGWSESGSELNPTARKMFAVCDAISRLADAALGRLGFDIKRHISQSTHSFLSNPKKLPSPSSRKWR